MVSGTLAAPGLGPLADDSGQLLQKERIALGLGHDGVGHRRARAAARPSAEPRTVRLSSLDRGASATWVTYDRGSQGGW